MVNLVEGKRNFDSRMRVDSNLPIGVMRLLAVRMQEETKSTPCGHDFRTFTELNLSNLNLHK